MKKERDELQRQKEELQRQREALQKQIDYYQISGGNRLSQSDQNNRSPSLSPHHTPHGSDPDLLSAAEEPKSQAQIGHRRSQSAEFVDNPEFLLDPRYSTSLTEPLNLKVTRAQQFDQLSQEKANLADSPDALGKSDNVSTSNMSLKRQNNNNNLQQTPSRPSSASLPPVKKQGSVSSNKQTKNILPLNLAESAKKAVAKTGQKKNSDVFYF